MSKMKPLTYCAHFVSEKIRSIDLNLDQYVTTDNLLQNKKGVVKAESLPANPSNVTRYVEGDTLLANIRPYLKKIWYADICGGCSADVLTFRAKSGINPKFLYYALFRDDFFDHVMRGSKGTKMPRGDKNQIMGFLVPDYAPKTQQKIAAVLSALDAKIECNNRINAELEAMAKTLYDYWFVQFNFPDHNGHPYKSSGGKMVYNPTLKRKIPAGWHHSTIGETFKTHLGGTPSREKDEYWSPGEVNWLSSAENPGTFVVDPDERISYLGLQNSPAKLLPQGTVILSIVRHLRASILGIDAATNQSVVGIVESSMFKHCFIYPYIVREIPRLMVLRTGAQQPHINKGVLDESLLAVPDKSTIEAYTSLAAPLFLQMKNYHQQNRELTQLRDWLLPMLMNGQVTVV